MKHKKNSRFIYALVKARMPEKLNKTYLDIFDQTIGCKYCNEADWAENSFDDLTLFHDVNCPLFGNRRALTAFYPTIDKSFWSNYKEKYESRLPGVATNTVDEWRKFTYLYSRLHNDEIEFSYQLMVNIAEILHVEEEFREVNQENRKKFILDTIKIRTGL